MRARNCRECGSMFAGPGSHCPTCREGAEARFQKIKDYLSIHPEADLPTLAAETGASEREILAALRDGRLVARGLALSVLTCKRCGRPIEQGRLCPSCANELADKMGSGLRPQKSETSSPARKVVNGRRSRMHVDVPRKEEPW